MSDGLYVVLSFHQLLIPVFAMSKSRRWTLISVDLEGSDPLNFDAVPVQEVLGCSIENLSNEGETYATLLLTFQSQITESSIRKKMPAGIDQLLMYDGRKRKRQDTQDCSTQTDVPVAVTGVIEKIKALKARVIELEEALQKAQDATDVNYIASFL